MFLLKKRTSFVLVIISAAFIFGLSGLRSDDKGFKVGVVDVFRVSDEYDYAKALKKKIESQIQAIKKEVEETRDDLKKLREELEVAGPNRKEEIIKLIQDKEDWLKIKLKRYEEQLKNQNKDYTSIIYKDILKAVEDYGKENGFDLILKSQTIPDKFVSEGEIAKQAATNIVVFSKKKYDITDAVITLLNTAYKEALKKKAAARKAAKDGKEEGK